MATAARTTLKPGTRTASQKLDKPHRKQLTDFLMPRILSITLLEALLLFVIDETQFLSELMDHIAIDDDHHGQYCHECHDHQRC